MELSRRLIPYEIRSGVRFFEQAHIKDVMAYLKIMINPRDELSWKRVLKLYPKIGEKPAADVWSSISATSDPLHAFLSVAQAILPARAGRIAGATQKSLDSLRSVLRPLDSEGMRRNPSESIR